MGREVIALVVVLAVIVVAGVYSLLFIKPQVKPAVQQQVVNATICLPTQAPQVINVVRANLGEKPLVGLTCLNQFAEIRYEHVVSYFLSTGIFGHVNFTEDRQRYSYLLPGETYEDLMLIPWNAAAVPYVTHYVLNYTNAKVFVNVRGMGNVLFIDVNGTTYEVVWSQAYNNLTAALMLFLVDPGHAYPILDPNATAIGIAYGSVTAPYSTCTYISMYEEAFCYGNQPTNYEVVVLEVS
jgi:hypothetical protein